jgi:hypothetical protein
MRRFVKEENYMKNLIKVSLFVCVLSALSGCEDKSQPDPQIAKLEERITALEEKVQDVELKVFFAGVKGPQEFATFDPQDEKAYLPVAAPTGPVLIILEKLEPYLDGFTVHMKIGNPSSASYSGLKAKVKWGRKFDSKKDDDFNSLKEKEIELKDFIAAGAWTVVKFNVAPAKADEVRRIVFQPDFNSLQMRSVGAQ